MTSAADVDHDGFLSQDELSALTVDKLKVLASAWSVSTSGLIKAEIIDALVRHQQTTLAAPSDPEWDGDTATWGPVDNALGYEVTLSCDDDDVETTVETTTDTTVDFNSAIGTRRGAFTFSVTAKGDGKKLLDSDPVESDENVKTVTLDPPTGLTFVDGVAHWSKYVDDYCEGFAIRLFSGETPMTDLIVIDDATTTGYDFTNDTEADGTYTYQICCLPTDDDYTEESDIATSPEYVRYTPPEITKLDAPTAAPKLEGGTLSWPRNKMAASYSVQMFKDGAVCGEPRITSSYSSFGVYNFRDRASGEGMYSFAYQYVGDGVTYATSDMSPRTYESDVRKLAAPTNIKLSGMDLSWDPVDGAVGYTYRLEGWQTKSWPTWVVAAKSTTEPSATIKFELPEDLTKLVVYVAAFSSQVASSLSIESDESSDDVLDSQETSSLMLGADSGFLNWSDPVTIDITDASEVSENG